MFFQHVYDKTLAQASYFIGCQKAGVAAVIDAKRDVDTYLEIAKQNNMKITHIFETHIHADFLAGSRELAALTGADMFLSAEGGEGWEYEFPHKPLKDGDVVMVGNLKMEVMHTPGHTPESISFLLTDTPASDEPVMLFTGDFVFVGDIGRPDLLEDPELSSTIGRARRMTEVDDIVSAWTLSRSKAEVLKLLNEAHVPCAPVKTAREVATDPHLEARGFWVDTDHPRRGKTRVPISAILLHTGGKSEIRTPAPTLGQHTDSVLGELLALQADELARLRTDGVTRPVTEKKA